ncbi:MAG: hypothetical protein ACPGOV_08370 [Magnetovibrionaceae bacterium]
MSNDPELDDIARKFLAAWQNQMSSMAEDAATTDLIERSMALAEANVQAFAAAANASTHDGSGSPAPAGSGAKASGSAHDDADDRLDGLTRRLDRLERRLLDLEQQLCAKSADGSSD